MEKLGMAHAARLIPGVMIALAGGLVVALGGTGGYALSFGIWTAGFLVLALGWGRLLAARLGSTVAPELHVLLGFAVMAHGVALPVMFFNLPILLPAMLVPLGLFGMFTKRDEMQATAVFALCLAAAAGFALIWAVDTSGRFETFAAGGPLRVWSDIFIHAGTIAEFGDPRAVGRGSSTMVDVPAILYHAVSHGVAGLALRMTRAGAMETVSGLWLPFGIFLMTLGVLATGRALAGLAGAALALGGLALLPDAAAYGLRQGFLSIHWMLETSPGSLYGLAVALGSLALLVDWTRQGDRATLALSALLLGGVFMLRAHIFVWMVVPWAVTVWLALPWPRPWMRVVPLVLGSMATIPALLWIARPEIETVGLTVFLTRYLDILHISQAPTGYDGLYPWLTAALGRAGAAPFGLLLALAGMGGVWLLTFVIGAVLAFRRGVLEVADTFPLALLAWSAELMLLAPSPFHGDYTDFRQRAFVLVFVALLAWSARFALVLIPRIARPVPLGVGACAALAATLAWMPMAKHSRMAWAAPLNVVQPRPGLVEAARWIGAEARVGDSFLVSAQRREEAVFDDATIVLGISGVPAWLSRPGVMLLSSPPRSTIAADRLARSIAWHAQPDIALAFAELRAAGIGFYLAPAAAPPAWDPQGRQAQFRAGEMLGWQIPR